MILKLMRYYYSFIRNLNLCGKHVDVVCQDDSGNPSSHSQSGKSNYEFLVIYRFCCGSLSVKLYLFGVLYFIGQNQKKNSGKLLISASATVGALLLVALMCFWGCFLYKKLGKVEIKSLAKDVGGGEPY